MRIDQLASRSNLKLAWRRLTTGGNHQYKRYFRHLYYDYEIALDNNLEDLRERLLGRSFSPQHPTRLYQPKASGLHRPISLLNIEDQIVLQAFANLAAKRMQKKRAPLQSTVVFSNILQKPDSIFFFRSWHATYAAFQRKIEKHYSDGMRWVGDFDLAAFYDTISHQLLLKTIYPRTKNDDLDWIAQCMEVWSSGRRQVSHGHGLPQGPLASDFLAECFLLPVDMKMTSRRGYVRYVDDVRLLGRSEDDVRRDLIELERLCRERGLIPQVGKFAIRRARNLEDAYGMLPSISDPQHERSEPQRMESSEARAAFRSALDGRPLRVADKTRLRYVLFRAEPDTVLLDLTLRLLPRHPEHADAFFHYLSLFNYRKPIEHLCLELAQSNPYGFIRGEAWHLLARYRRIPRSDTVARADRLVDAAIRVVKAESCEMSELWGACHFLCVSEEVSGSRHSDFVMYVDPILQSFLAPALPDSAFDPSRAVERYLKRSSFEPGLSVCTRLALRGLGPSTYGLSADDLASQVVNTLLQLGVLTGIRPSVDPIAEILGARFGVPQGKSWQALLGADYSQALVLLKTADAVFDSGPSHWLSHLNSFNHTVFLALQRHLRATSHPAACTTVGKGGKPVKFGVLIDANQAFSLNCAGIGTGFRETNSRRNRLPGSHPFDEKTGAPTRALTRQERNRLVGLLQLAYNDIVQLMP